MRRIWLASAGFMLAMGALATVTIVRDRAAVLQTITERTDSVARLIMAHGEEAIENANKIVAALDGPVRAWDLSDPQEGRRLSASIGELLAGSPQISSVWVVDGRGISRLDSWTYPAKPIDATERPYFRAHLAGAPEPVILGDSTPGAVTGKQRFTFSRSQRDPDGALHAVLVVGIYNGYFDRLYAKVASWPGARAGLYSFDGGVLGRLQSPQRASPEFIAEIEAGVRSSPGGSKIIAEPDGIRLASWQRSARYPSLYATSSQPVELALANWRQRSWALGLATGLAALGVSGLTFFALRASVARQAVRQQEILAREVHHRVKNSLQMAVSLLSLRARQAPEPSARDALVEASQQVSAIADVHELIQEAAALDRVDVCDLLRQLCTHLEDRPEKQLAFHSEMPLLIAAAPAVNLAIVSNELIANALKHARMRVWVDCSHEPDAFTLEVRDDGPGLPPGFAVGRNARFGLRMAAGIATQLGGTLTARSEGDVTTFSLRIPLARLAAGDAAPGRDHLASRGDGRTRRQG